jgi:pyruvate/2-oxoglutarate/acetoin dehydrogenase E1 component
MRKIKYGEAINEALMEEMERDETVFLIGETVSADIYLHHQGLYEKFGRSRVRDTEQRWLATGRSPTSCSPIFWLSLLMR